MQEEEEEECIRETGKVDRGVTVKNNPLDKEKPL